MLPSFQFALMVRLDYSINAFKLNSRQPAGKVYPREINIKETHTKHHKLDSQATLSHRARGRPADGLRAQVRPLSRPPRPSWQLQAEHEPVGRSSSTLPNPSIFLAGLWLQPPLPLLSWTSAALTLPMSLLNPCRVISQPRGIRLIFGWDLLISGCPRQLKKNGRH